MICHDVKGIGWTRCNITMVDVQKLYERICLGRRSDACHVEFMGSSVQASPKQATGMALSPGVFHFNLTPPRSHAPFTCPVHTPPVRVPRSHPAGAAAAKRPAGRSHISFTRPVHTSRSLTRPVHTRPVRTSQPSGPPAGRTSRCRPTSPSSCRPPAACVTRRSRRPSTMRRPSYVARRRCGRSLTAAVSWASSSTPTSAGRRMDAGCSCGSRATTGTRRWQRPSSPPAMPPPPSQTTSPACTVRDGVPDSIDGRRTSSDSRSPSSRRWPPPAAMTRPSFVPNLRKNPFSADCYHLFQSDRKLIYGESTFF